MKVLSDKQNEALEKMKNLAAELGSEAAACKQAGISQSVYTAVKKGTYTGDVDKQLAKVIDYFATKEAAAVLYAGTGYVPTTISSDVQKVIRNCQLQGGLAIACGDAGIGKTEACKEYSRKHSTTCVYVTVNPCIKSAKAVLELIGAQINVSSGSVSRLWLDITAKLSDGMVIIIDEAQHLTYKTIESLRSICDYFDAKGQTLGIAFVGNETTVNQLGGKQKAEFAQIRNRTKNTRIYSSKKVQRSDIELLFPELVDDVPALEFMLRIVQSSQAVRGAVNLYSNAHDNGNVTHKGLVAMAKYMEMEV